MVIETITKHRIQIARDVNKDTNGATAIFSDNETGELLCAAWFVSPDFKKIRIAPDWKTMERASAVSIAVQMAIEWLADQV